MRMTKENAGKLYDKAGEDLLKAGLRNQVPNSVIMRFWDVVSDVADRSKYAEGAEISAEDLNSLCDVQNDILAEFSDNIVTSWGSLDEDELAKADSRSAFMLLNDYLFAYALKELGCEIPANFGRRGELNVTNAIKTTNSTGKQAAFEATENEVSFSRQRRKDSDVLKRELGGLETALSEKNPSALQVAKYLGEYRALKMRQENHTRFWKFFHRGENKARNELLAHMKGKLESVLGTNAHIDEMEHDVTGIANSYHVKTVSRKQLEKDFKPDQLSARHDDFDPDAFEYNRLEQEMVNKNKDLNARLSQSLKENENKSIEGMVNDQPKPQLSKHAIN